MAKQANPKVSVRVTYDGAGPVHWSSGAFGLQDKAEALHPGAANADGSVVFTFSLDLKEDGATPNFLGDFAHGPRDGRFLYLSWRNRTGEYAQRLKLPLTTIGWDAVRSALETGAPLACLLIDKNPRATTTGANIGGTRPVVWMVGEP
jgi:hypothetical protein